VTHCQIYLFIFGVKEKQFEKKNELLSSSFGTHLFKEPDVDAHL
jgi:hypothetical protein